MLENCVYSLNERSIDGATWFDLHNIDEDSVGALAEKGRKIHVIQPIGSIIDFTNLNGFRTTKYQNV